jgi:hypothetical protein
MATPILGNANKVTKGQQLFSLPVLAERINKLEDKISEREQTGNSSYETLDQELDALVKLVADLTKRLEQHIKFGHPVGNKPQVENKKNG